MQGAVYEEIEQRSFERLFLGLTEDSMTLATLSAGQSGIGYKRARDIAAPAHLRALMAAKPRIQAMIQDGVTAGLLAQQPLETRVAAVIETAISTYLSALGDEDSATTKVVCSEGGAGSRRSLAANHRGTAGTRRDKPDHRTPRTSQPRLSGRGQ